MPNPYRYSGYRKRSVSGGLIYMLDVPPNVQ